MAAFVRAAPTDFVVGQMYESESTQAYDEIVNSPNGPLDADAAKTQAELSYQKINCSLIQ
jgi:hypothetical protein